MLKNKCGARVGDIWGLGKDGHKYLLLELKNPLWNNDEDTFLAVCLDTGKYDDVFFSHFRTMGWSRVA